eukprot:m51a1_g9707 hypothetical protein (319) ;mRNA; f:1397947-1399305
MPSNTPSPPSAVGPPSLLLSFSTLSYGRRYSFVIVATREWRVKQGLAESDFALAGQTARTVCAHTGLMLICDECPSVVQVARAGQDGPCVPAVSTNDTGQVEERYAFYVRRSCTHVQEDQSLLLVVKLGDCDITGGPFKLSVRRKLSDSTERKPRGRSVKSSSSSSAQPQQSQQSQQSLQQSPPLGQELMVRTPGGSVFPALAPRAQQGQQGAQGPVATLHIFRPLPNQLVVTVRLYFPLPALFLDHVSRIRDLIKVNLPSFVNSMINTTDQRNQAVAVAVFRSYDAICAAEVLINQYCACNPQLLDIQEWILSQNML